MYVLNSPVVAVLRLTVWGVMNYAANGALEDPIVTLLLTKWSNELWSLQAYQPHENHSGWIAARISVQALFHGRLEKRCCGT
jgi:hypothetical protein